ncbi:cyanophycinase [Neptunicella sp.]|uniref:cyanophycinase n=1 Tax=Neptunicella sp. TaxID=2125986 RepID=UPI003F693B82
MVKIAVPLIILNVFIGSQALANVADIDAKIRNYAANVGANYDLALVGGGLKTCSSFHPEQCIDSSYVKQGKSEEKYKISQSGIDLFLASELFLQQPEPLRDNLKQVIGYIYADFEGRTFTRANLKKVFSTIDSPSLNGTEIYRNMPNDLYHALLDCLQTIQLNEKNQRVTEKVDLANNKNRQARFVYQKFVEIAQHRAGKGNKPKIAIITASSRDPFEAIDFYLDVFTQAGAEVVWLPLDQTYQSARFLEAMGVNGCQRLTELREKQGSFNREAVYPKYTEMQRQYCQQPQKMLDQLASLDGVFFNGGDQSLTLKALRKFDGSPTAELALIQTRMLAHQLVVGGTSAGTAVQSGGEFNHRPIPMISNGSSAHAFLRGVFAIAPPLESCGTDQDCGNGLQGADVTYNHQGGTGLFNSGIVDTHFSERDREGRLAMLATQTQTRYGFGVDEATALLVSVKPDTTDMAVIGHGGVWIVDTQHSIFKQQEGKRQLVATTHYLNHGDKLSIDKASSQMQIQLSGRKLSEPEAIEPAYPEGQWRQQLFQHCGLAQPLKWTLDNIAMVVQPTNDSHFTVSGGDSLKRCSYTNLVFGMER